MVFLIKWCIGKSVKVAEGRIGKKMNGKWLILCCDNYFGTNLNPRNTKYYGTKVVYDIRVNWIHATRNVANQKNTTPISESGCICRYYFVKLEPCENVRPARALLPF